MSFASNRVAQLETAYNNASSAGVVGIISVTVDGVATQFSSLAELYDEYLKWKSRAARENGTRPRVSQIYLGGIR